MKALFDIFEENPNCNKFVIWKRNSYKDVYDIDVKLVNEDGIDWRSAPSNKINWFKVIFNKKYRKAIKDCFDYAMWHADTYRGDNSAEVILAEFNTGIQSRRDNSTEYHISVSKHGMKREE